MFRRAQRQQPFVRRLFIEKFPAEVNASPVRLVNKDDIISAVVLVLAGAMALSILMWVIDRSVHRQCNCPEHSARP